MQEERPSLHLQFQLAAAFFRVGMLGFGGGPSAIPLFHLEVVKKYKWMDDNEFSDILALANTMPGPIATKMAGYIGYRVGGVLGCLNALFFSVIPTIYLMVGFLVLLQANKDIPIVNSMSNAVVPVVTVMIGLMTWDFFVKSKEGLGSTKSFIVIGLSGLLIYLVQVHPAIVIIALFMFVFMPLLKRRRGRG
ncbi:chromate transporter [Sutcliffiella cohnii]